LPIRARLIAWTMALVALIVAALGTFLALRLRSDLVSGVDEGLDTRAAQIALGLRSGCEGEFRDVSDASLVGLPRGEAGAQLLGADGSVLESSGDPVSRQRIVTGAALVEAFRGHTVRETLTAAPEAEEFRVLAVRLPARGCDGIVVVATALDEVNHSVDRLIALLAVAGPVMVAIAGAGGWLLARRALAPVAHMTREAEGVAIDRLDERIDVPRTADELQRLAVTLNTMLDRLQRGVQEKRRFVADASHELRTPLAVMRSELDVSLREQGASADSRQVMSSLREEVERMSTIVENLLTLARIDEGELRLLHTPLDLSHVARAAVDALAPLAEMRSVGIRVDGQRAPAVADEARLGQVVTNLVANAVRYSRPGGEVRVSTWLRQEDAGCMVSDQGPGIPAEVVPSIFDRFVRADVTRSSASGGSGLGLAICREIVEAHGGHISVRSSVGRGSSFSFTVPRRQRVPDADAVADGPEVAPLGDSFRMPSRTMP
jgi:two-component system, OmpR family, sensor kinase